MPFEISYFCVLRKNNAYHGLMFFSATSLNMLIASNFEPIADPPRNLPPWMSEKAWMAGRGVSGTPTRMNFPKGLSMLDTEK